MLITCEVHGIGHAADAPCLRCYLGMPAPRTRHVVPWYFSAGDLLGLARIALCGAALVALEELTMRIERYVDRWAEEDAHDPTM